jgi:hypothetical protein
MRFCQRQDGKHEHDLAREHDAPAEVGRCPASEDRTDRDAGAGDAADDRVRRFAGVALEVARDERGERRKHERGADSFEDRPAECENCDGRRERRHQRSAAIDDQSDDERAAASDDVADLAARHHEHRHHEAVQRDHCLNRRDRRVEVVDQRADRHVHHRLVEHHYELGSGQCDQCPPFHRG